MIRFPNPGSDINSFIRIYKEIFISLNNKDKFSLDDFSSILIEKNLATSCGYMGQEALSRSTREDRTRDPLYNQSKMYSELFKSLGWIHPTEEKKLDLKLTYFGAHLVAAEQDPSAIFKQSVLGMAYPNPIINVKSSNKIRPFAAILKTMYSLDGLITRDEMIVGPLSLKDDRDDIEFNQMINMLKAMRGDFKKLQKEMNKVSRNLSISMNTMCNYTRFPIGVLKWTNWASDVSNKSIYKKSIPFLELTSIGNNVVKEIINSIDIRNHDLEKVDSDSKRLIVLLSFFQILNKSGFDVLETLNEYQKDIKILNKVIRGKNNILFSPFQELDLKYLNTIFPDISGKHISDENKREIIDSNNKEHILTHYVQANNTSTVVTDGSTIDIIKQIQDYFKQYQNIDNVIDKVCNNYIYSNKDTFYPLISDIFNYLGFNCELSRPGVNYQRWDAIIIDDEQSIPIEIKSPGEEEYLSLKSVRQALENKIVLLSRKSYPTLPETSSLVVGYKFPNERAEVNRLLLDIHKSYGFIIGIIDFYSLLFLTCKKLILKKSINRSDLFKLHGFINAKDI